jgi:hypothetical protein
MLTWFALIAATQAQAEGAFERYGVCLRRHVKLVVTEKTAAASAQRAIAECQAQRRELLAETETLLRREHGSSARLGAERRVAMIDAVVPAMISERPVQIVPKEECSSELKDREHCLE